MPSAEEFSVGWICALSNEFVAAQAFFDEAYEDQPYLPNNKNDYAYGRIGKHKVVVSVLPMGEYGTATASRVAEAMLHSFKNIRIALMVGIAGGAPSKKHDIRLGDIVVSAPGAGKGGVYYYDYGKTIQGQEFEATAFLDQPPHILRAAANGLKGRYELDGNEIHEAINKALERKPKLRKKYKRPDPASDRLYRSDYVHQDKDESCDSACGKDPSHLESREPRDEDDDPVMIHYGLIASGNSLMKDAIIRDKFAKKNEVLCFEMEASGLMNHFPCLVIRGICDYSDSHKNKEWQGYAAMAAAAYAKDLLYRIQPQLVENEKTVADIVNQTHNHYHFGDNNNGVQVGVNHGSMNGNFYR